MGDIDREDDSLAIELYGNITTGQWEEVVKMYENHKIKAFSAKINPSGDTALHVAVSIAPDEVVRELVRVIKDWYEEEVQKINDRYDEEVKKINDRYDEEVKKIDDRYDEVKYLECGFEYMSCRRSERDYDIEVCDENKKKEIAGILDSAVWIKNNEGNTPLHVAASTGRIAICILLITSFESGRSPGVHNKVGESPLFLAAFHGHKELFLCLHLFFLLGNSNIDVESIGPAYSRKDGETILHCAMRLEYFGEHFFLTLCASPIKYIRNYCSILGEIYVK